ncbi:hypothetical protein [Candidatus Symbiopectobacterium sp. PLON1]
MAEEHSKILRAIETRNSDLCAELLARHQNGARASLHAD